MLKPNQSLLVNVANAPRQNSSFGKIMKAIALTLLLLVGIARVCAAETAQGVSVEVFHVAISGGMEQKRGSSPTGVSVLRDRFDILEKSMGIPLMKGHGLAVMFTLGGEYARLESVRLVVKFPEMKAPSGDVYSGIDRIQKTMSVDGTSMVAFSYSFDEEWEFVEGIWTVQIFDGDQLLGEAQAIAFDPKKVEPNQPVEPTPTALRASGAAHF